MPQETIRSGWMRITGGPSRASARPRTSTARGRRGFVVHTPPSAAVQGGAYPTPMSLVHACSAPGCSALTMSDRCLEHERVGQARLLTRAGTVVDRFRAPAIALALAAVAALLGRASGRLVP